MEHISLNNKTFIVAGAGGLIGQEIIKSLQYSKANIIAADYSQSSLDDLKKNIERIDNILFIKIDINNDNSIDNLFSESLKIFSSIDGAINTAYPRNKNYGKDFLDVAHSDFSENLSLHLGGYFLFMQQCLKYSLNNDQKFSLVNISSIYGSMAPRFSIYNGTKMTMPVEYAAIKSALQHLSSYVTAYIKTYHKNSKFRVNCVSPGGIFDHQDSKFLDQYNSHCLKKGMLDVKDIIGTITFLLSNHAENIYSQNIVIDNGFSI